MSNAAKLIVAVIVVAVIGGGAFLLLGKDENKKDSSQTQSTSQNETQDDQSTDEGTVAATITYDGSSFSSSAATITAGSKVKVVNNSSDDLDFDSDPHPVHTDNPELNAGDIPPGESITFTLTTKGTWGFHNHLNSSQQGEITVQ